MSYLLPVLIFYYSKTNLNAQIMLIHSDYETGLKTFIFIMKWQLKCQWIHTCVSRLQTLFHIFLLSYQQHDTLSPVTLRFISFWLLWWQISLKQSHWLWTCVHEPHESRGGSLFLFFITYFVHCAGLACGNCYVTPEAPGSYRKIELHAIQI